MVDKFEAEALSRARALGIPEEEMRPVLKGLLRMYGDDWALIAEDNYRTLLDAYFEYKEDMKLDNKKSRGLEGHGGTSARQTKRMHVGGGKEERNSLKIGKSVPEESQTPLSIPRRNNENSSRPQASDSRLGMRPLVPVRTDIKREASSASLYVSSGDRKSVSSRGTSSKVFHKKSPSEPGSANLLRETKGLPRSSSDTQINDLALSRKPVPASRLGNSARDLNGQGSSSLEHRNPVPLDRKRDRQTNIDLPLSRKPVPASRLGNSVTVLNGQGESSSEHRNVVTLDRKRAINFIEDISKGTEKIKISLVIDVPGNEKLPKFNYIPNNIIYQHANINISLARIADEACCSGCSGNCLSTIPCACARETGGDFAYTPSGLLKEEFLRACLTMKEEPREKHFFFCKDCPLEKARNDYTPGRCKGHLIRKFIKECWRKCGCDMKCGNRVVQRGISCKLQVFIASEEKGWGLRSLEALPKGTFVCEYIGEVLTNSEMYERNMSISSERHTYPVTLDADWGSEGILEDEEALCLDATFNGNVARFINHRCSDANLADIPVEVETPDHHYYHLAFFTTRDVAALEELTWDYGIDFDDTNHPIEAFSCRCGSAKCRGNGYGKYQSD